MPKHFKFKNRAHTCTSGSVPGSVAPVLSEGMDQVHAVLDAIYTEVSLWRYQKSYNLAQGLKQLGRHCAVSIFLSGNPSQDRNFSTILSFLRFASSLFARNYYNDLMGENQFFLSYSRSQLYFAEALALSLQKAGLVVWMDLQQLEPGSDWQDQIDEGLRNCAALILVASKQSLSSPYVESEWRAVLDSGKPVYIACYEEVNLPAALQSASLVDFRGSFRKAILVLINALENMSSVRERVQSPNALGLPQRMPPIIMLVAGLLVIGAFFPLLGNFTALGGIRGQLVCLGVAVPATLSIAWHFLHHRIAIMAGRFAFWASLIFLSGLVERLGTRADIGSLISCFLPYLVVLTSIYLLERGSFGAELLRWSIPGGDAEIDLLRRRFHKSPITKDNQVQAVRRQAITARDPENKNPAVVEPPRGAPVLHPVHAGEETRTYSLHYDMADHPVVTTVRKILNKEGLQEVDLDAKNRIGVLSENFPRSKLQELLDSGEPVILLLVGNITFKGDALLERVTSLQLIDYRERSKPTLTALAQTLTEVPDGNLPVGFETTPRPLNSTVLPQYAAEMSLLVLSIGGWLVLSGLISLTQSLAGTAPVSILDLAGFVCGLIWIKLSKAFRLRETTNFGFVPAFLISTWLATPLFFGSPFVLAEVLSTNAVFDWRITLSSLFTSEGYLGCLLCPGGLLVIVIAIAWNRRLGDWLPATVSRREPGDRFIPLILAPATRWSWIGWNLSALILGALSSFGIKAAIYAFFLLIKPHP